MAMKIDEYENTSCTYIGWVFRALSMGEIKFWKKILIWHHNPLTSLNRARY